MNYIVFRKAVLEWVSGSDGWTVNTDWEETQDGEDPAGRAGEMSREAGESGMPEDFIELEQERGAFYEFMTVSLNRLYFTYREEGWDAVRRELDRYLRRESAAAGRRRGIDYEARLGKEDAELYRRLRRRRAEIALQKGVPPYFVFMNRALFEMAQRRPGTMEELCLVYGVGKKNSGDYGQMFLEEIRGFAGRKDTAGADGAGGDFSDQPASEATG